MKDGVDREDLVAAVVFFVNNADPAVIDGEVAIAGPQAQGVAQDRSDRPAVAHDENLLVGVARDKLREDPCGAGIKLLSALPAGGAEVRRVK